jgi:sugar lactone lactonase YvrE
MRRILVFCVCAVAVAAGCGTEPEPGPREPVDGATTTSPAALLETYEHARAADAAGDTETFCRLTAELVDSWPAHPRLMLDLARCKVIEGDPDSALDLLDLLASMKIAIDLSENVELQSLANRPRFAAIQEHNATVGDSIVTSEVAFRLDDPEFVPEDIAWDPVSGDYFVSSIRKRKILRIGSEGEQSVFAGYPETPMLCALSMAVDPERRRLWLTTAGAPSMIDYRAEEHEGASELLAFDLDSGVLQVRVPAPPNAERHELNDLIIESGGSVLVGDAPVGAVYRYSFGGEGFEIVAPPGTMFSPQGIVVFPDGGGVVVADYSRGLCRLDPDGSVQILRSPPDAWLGGIDGLSRAGRRELVAVQNGVNPSRVVRVLLTEEVDAVASVEILDLAHPEHDQPTLGEIIDGEFFYVANSLWGAWDSGGNLIEGRELSPPVILRIPLG